jgi:gas vesicle protein
VPVPILAFLGGAALGAVAAWLVKDRLDRRTYEDEIDSAAEAAGAAGDRVVEAFEEVTESVSEAVQDVAEAVQTEVTQARSPKSRQRRTPKPTAS